MTGLQLIDLYQIAAAANGNPASIENNARDRGGHPGVRGRPRRNATFRPLVEALADVNSGAVRMAIGASRLAQP